jgi:hypothetical protein
MSVYRDVQCTPYYLRHLVLATVRDLHEAMDGRSWVAGLTSWWYRCEVPNVDCLELCRSIRNGVVTSLR